MIRRVTDRAAWRLNEMACEFSMPHDQVYFQITPRPQDNIYIWIIEPTLTFDENKFCLHDVDGFRLLVEKDGAVYLTHATLDYGGGKEVTDYPCWPDGFVLRHQAEGMT